MQPAQRMTDCLVKAATCGKIGGANGSGAVALLEALKEEIVGWVKGELPEVDIGLIRGALENPRQEAHGDCSLPMMKLRIGGAATGAAAAARLAASFRPFGHVVEARAVDSFLNFSWDARRIVAAAVPEILQKGSRYGHNSDGEGRLVLVEYGSPNMAKPFHAGHLRSAVLGAFLAAVYKANGYAVHTLNYLGDWGKQYGLLAVGMGRYGDDERLAADPIRHLFDVYVRINADADADPTVHDEARAAFQRMEAGDESVLSLWRHCRDVSIEAYRAMYARLNISFDEYTGESCYGLSALAAELSALREANLLKESEGAQIVDLTDARLGTPLLVKKDGSALYLTRDIAAARDRWETHRFYKSIYVIGATQDLHMKQLKAILTKMGCQWADRIEHVNYGLVRGMSTRKGTAVFLEDILNESTEVMHGVMRSNAAKYAQLVNPEETAAQLALSAIFIQDFAAKRIKDYDFQWSRMTSFEGDTGPYLQYTHARLSSIIKKALDAQLNANTEADTSELVDAEPKNQSVDKVSGLLDSPDLDLIAEPAAHKLVLHLLKFPQIVQDACRTHEPCLVVTYLMALCHSLSSLLESLYVLNQPKPIQAARLALYSAARIVLANGITLLGLNPLTQM